MTTITLKVDERSKKGKAFMEFAKTFFTNEKEVELVESGTKTTKVEAKSIYSKAFIAKIKRAEQNIKNGNTITLDPDNIWGSLGLK